MAYSLRLYDVVRVDHFRGFDEYYSIPYGDATAEFGHWEPGPGLEIFQKMQEFIWKEEAADHCRGPGLSHPIGAETVKKQPFSRHEGAGIRL